MAKPAEAGSCKRPKVVVIFSSPGTSPAIDTTESDNYDNIDSDNILIPIPARTAVVNENVPTFSQKQYFTTLITAAARYIG